MIPPTGTLIASPDAPIEALDGIASILGQCRAIHTGPFTAVPRDGDLATRTLWITRGWYATFNWRRQSRHAHVVAELKDLMKRWKKSGNATQLTRPAPPVLSLGNPDLNDWMWDPDTSRSYPIDLTYAGVSDAVYDLADHIEHPARRFSNTDWTKRLPDFGVCDDETQDRLIAMRRLIALFWLRKLWPVGEPTEVFRVQLTRVRHLFGDLTG